MVRPEGAISNPLFEILEDWERQLQHIDEDVWEQSPAKQKVDLEGPEL